MSDAILQGIVKRLDAISYHSGARDEKIDQVHADITALSRKLDAHMSDEEDDMQRLLRGQELIFSAFPRGADDKPDVHEHFDFHIDQRTTRRRWADRLDKWIVAFGYGIGILVLIFVAQAVWDAIKAHLK